MHGLAKLARPTAGLGARSATQEAFAIHPKLRQRFDTTFRTHPMTMSRTSLLAAVAALLVAPSILAQATLSPLTSFGTNGWLTPGTIPQLGTANNERGFAYNPTTNNLVLVSRTGGPNVRILDGNVGADLGGLNVTGINGGTFVVNMGGVADDGSIYVCNLATSVAGPFKVYKWDSEALGLITGGNQVPTAAFNASAGVTRVGDAFDVHGGSGGNPIQFVTAGTNTVSIGNFAIGLLDGTNTVTPYLSVPGTVATSNDYRLGLTFVDNDTIIGKGDNAARMTSVAGGVATVDASIALGTQARRPMDYAVIGGRPLLAVIDTNSSVVSILDLTVPGTPVIIAQGTTTTGTLTANANGTGAVQWGAINGNVATLYAMSSNQGIQAFTFNLAPTASAPTYGTGCDGLVIGTNGLPSIGNAGFELVVSNVPVISPVAFVAFGTTVINPGVDLTFVDMAGCFAYNTLDLDLIPSGPVVGGTSLFPLAIPNDLALLNASIAAQGVSLSLTTVLGLATSNGVNMVFGF